MTGTDFATDVTGSLARHLVAARYEDLPETVRHEAARALLNWVGVAVGASHHETVAAALAAVKPFAGPPQATLLGRSERVDSLNAALLNGISSHVFDFDDTDLLTSIHPSAPVAPAILALAEYRPVSGRDFVAAFVQGVETECRIGRTVNPAHSAIGWHITGTAGVFGAAAACGRLLGLDEQGMRWALGLAATQPVGLRDMFGTMTKSFHPGRSAQNGLGAALFAAAGYTASDDAIAARRGWANVLSAEQHYAAITEGLGTQYEIMRNSYKPFACGLVVHAVIDGCIRLRNAHALDPAAIERVELAVNPIVLELTAKRTPQTGLEGKFSVFHAAAVAIVAGAAGEPQFSDAAVRDPTTVAVRERVSTVVDPAIHKDQARVAVVLKTGARHECFVEHAVGSIEVPMTDRQLEAKFTSLAEGILPAAQTRRLIDLCWNVATLTDAGDIARAAAQHGA